MSDCDLFNLFAGDLLSKMHSALKLLELSYGHHVKLNGIVFGLIKPDIRTKKPQLCGWGLTVEPGFRRNPERALRLRSSSRYCPVLQAFRPYGFSYHLQLSPR